MPDQKVGRRPQDYSRAIPDQKNPPLKPFISIPDISSYYRYQQNGVNFLQAIMAQ